MKNKKKNLVWIVAYTKYDQGDFWLLAYQLFLARPSSGVCSTQMGFTYPLVHLQKLWYYSIRNICNFNCQLVLAPVFKYIFPFQVDIGERWLCRALDLNGLKHWRSHHDVIFKFIACAKIRVTLFHVSNVFWVIVY
jgi:hypothetical protein